MTNEISFKQNIRFVDAQTFWKQISKKQKDIGFSPSSPLYIKGERLATYSIMTCTAGGFRNAKGEAVGFHNFDCWENYKHAEENCNKIYDAANMPVSGLLIGSKKLKGSRYSRSIFSKMEKFFTEKIEKLSIFREHKHSDGSTSFLYDSKTDTYTILAQWGYGNYVKNIEDLRNFYKKIIIANGDKVFIGSEEIYPENILTPYCGEKE